MAETLAVLTTEFAEKLLYIYSKASIVALDDFYLEKQYKRISDSNYKSLFMKSTFQIFLKDKDFCNDDFHMVMIKNIHLGDVYCISRISGQGHIQIFGRSVNVDRWEISAGYPKSFETAEGIFSPPSSQLKNFYKGIALTMKRLAKDSNDNPAR